MRSKQIAVAALIGWILVFAYSPTAMASAPHVTSEDALRKALHLRVDANGSWGIGSQMYLGGQVHGFLQWSMWHSRLATGSLDLSLRMAYGYEPAFFAPWRDPNDGQINERFQGQIGIGHTFHMGSKRNVSLGFSVLFGWNHFHQYAPVDWPDVEVKGEATVRHNHLVISGEMTLAFRFHQRVGLNLAVSAPFPTITSYLITMVQVSAGLSLYLF